MTEAAFYLLRCTLRNRARRMVRQLRSPRYALAVIVGVAYLALVLLGQRQGHNAGVGSTYLASGGTLFLAALVAKWWLVGADRTALAFSPAEIQFLFPAPLHRVQLLGYKLGRTQLLILFNVLIWTVLFWRRSDGAGLIVHLVGLWILFTILSMHRLGAALTRDSVMQHGAAGWRRAWPALIVIATYLVGAYVSFRRVGAQPENPLDGLRLLVETAPLRWLLLPFHLPLAPLAADTATDFVRALPAALGLIGLHLVWILRADQSFEEAAIDASARRAELLARWRRQGTVMPLRPGGSRRRLPLAGSGLPVAAIIWKNHTRLLRTVSPGFLIAAVLLLAGVVAAVAIGVGGRGGILGFSGMLALTWAAVLALLGPQWVRVDLRGELGHLDLIRTWPLSGREIMTGMILSSALVLTALQLALGGFGVGALALQGELKLPAGQLLALGAVGAMVLAGVNVITLGIQNGGALLFPSWVRTEIRPGGIEQMGQHLLTAGASFLLLLLFLLGPTLVGGGIGYLSYPHFELWGMLPAALAGTAGLALEAFLLVDWLGDRFESGARDEQG